jgi:hypothetical protein
MVEVRNVEIEQVGRTGEEEVIECPITICWNRNSINGHFISVDYSSVSISVFVIHIHLNRYPSEIIQVVILAVSIDMVNLRIIVRIIYPLPGYDLVLWSENTIQMIIRIAI